MFEDWEILREEDLFLHPEDWFPWQFHLFDFHDTITFHDISILKLTFNIYELKVN